MVCTEDRLRKKNIYFYFEFDYFIKQERTYTSVIIFIYCANELSSAKLVFFSNKKILSPHYIT